MSDTSNAAVDSHDAAASADDDRRALERAVEEARQQTEARAAFIATISHELREPMNGVLGMARLLRETPLDDEQAGYVDAVIGSAEALVTIVNDILDLSRIDAGKLEIVDTDFALRPFFERFAQMIEPRARRKGLAFRIALDEALPAMVRGDPGRLRQILVNLAGNAIKFTEAGEVTLEVRAVAASDEAIELDVAVSDTGIGIPEAETDRLFTAFAQAEGRTQRVYGGSGLGLMIAQRLAELMDGRIEARNREEGGARFDLKVRLARADETGDDEAPPAGLGGTSLLVVDAQTRTRTIMQQLATQWGLIVHMAGSAAQAEARLQDCADRGEPVEIVVIDRALPDMPGDDLGARIRENAAFANPHLVLLSSSGMRGDAARAREIGFDAYLPKPVTAATFLDCLKRLRRGGAQGGLITVHSMSEEEKPKLDILVADDNAVNTRLATIMLERAGHRITAVTNGAEAVAALKRQDFDVILMDVQMPVMNGIEATRQIRAMADPRKAATPIVAITANAMRGDDDSCYAAGMSAYVSKPIDRASLLAAVEGEGRRTARAG